VNDDDQLLETGRLAELGLQASTLVHELRQPVFAIKAIAQLALDESGVNESDRLKELLSQVAVLEALIHRYGDASRKPTGIRAPADLGHAIALGVDVVRGHRQGVGIELQLPQEGAWCRIDPVAAQQITSNLVRNAVDAARGSVRVALQGTTLSVQDDGHGILPEIEERLCEPFVTSKPPGEGTGLGLTVTRSLIASIGGTFTWKTGDSGTCFQVEFQND